MKLTSHKSIVRRLNKEDPNFMIPDGIMLTPRAGFELNTQMPNGYKLIIHECIERGWLKPVAHVTERELLFMGLSK
jgi:hypothetical protein